MVRVSMDRPRVRFDRVLLLGHFSSRAGCIPQSRGHSSSGCAAAGGTVRVRADPPNGNQTALNRNRRRRAAVVQNPANCKSAMPDGRQICYAFNTGKDKCKFGTNCKRAHACRRCFGNHPLQQCAVGQKQPGGATQ